MKRVAALTAILAIALNALWPLIAQAEPSKSPFVAVVCATGNGIHAVDLTGKQPGGGAQGHDHCKLCVTSGDRLALPPENAVSVFDTGASFPSPAWENRVPIVSAYLLSAPPRGPPAVLPG